MLFTTLKSNIIKKAAFRATFLVIPGKATFARCRTIIALLNLSLPSSEWDRVGQLKINTK